MRLSVFGTVGVTAGAESDAVVELPQRPGRVLAVLATAHGRTVRDDVLVDAIWPEAPPASAKQALQGYIVALRNAIEPGRPSGDFGSFVIREATGYRLEADADRLDLAEFETLGAALRLGTDERTLDRMIELSDQRLVADVGEASWLVQIRSKVSELRLAALVERFELELDTGSGAPLLARMRQAVTEYPFDEQLRMSLMTALYRSGRQAEALAAYEQLRRRLRDEMGVSPSEGLAALHLDVLNQASSLDLVGASSSHLVADHDGLSGRADDVAAVVEVVLAQRAVTIVGPGGAGKSALLRAVLGRLAEKFPTPISIDASTTGDGALLDEVVRAIGADRHPLMATHEVLAGGLGDQVQLVVIDTCEAQLDEVRAVVDDMYELESVSVLLASRQPVRHRGEHVHRLSGLAPDDATALLKSLVGAGSDTDEHALELLAARVDGLPLALEMIAPRVASLGAATVLRELDDSETTVPASTPAHGPDRHRSIDALVSWSLDRLEPVELELLIRCVAVYGSFPIESLDDLPAQPDLPIASTLAALVDASLVNRSGDAPARFHVFDTVCSTVHRRFTERLATERAVVDAHVVNTAWADYTGAAVAPLPDWVALRFGATLDRILAAPDNRAIMLATAAARRWLDRGSLQRGATVLERALTGAPDAVAPLASIGWAVLGFNRLYLGEIPRSLDAYRRSAETATTVPMDGFAALVDASVAWLECDFDRSWAIAAGAVEQMTTPSRRAPANLVGFAKSALYAGDLDGAADCYRRAMMLARTSDDRFAEANAVRLNAVVDALRGDHDRALATALRSAALHTAAESTLGAAQATSTVALVAALADDAPTAAAWSARAIALARRQFDVQTIGVVLPVIASIDVDNDRSEHAARLVGWLDHYIDQQQHVRHPTTAALFERIDAALATLPEADRRRWRAEGAALSAARMIDLAGE